MKKANHISEQAKATLTIWGIFAAIALVVILFNACKSNNHCYDVYRANRPVTSHEQLVLDSLNNSIK